MRNFAILVIAFASLSAFAAQPADTLPDYTALRGTGGLSCGKFIESRQQNNIGQQQLFVQWVWGFLSAYNMHGNFASKYHRTPQLRDIPDEQTVLLYLDTHCNQYPLHNVLQGTLSLIKDLGSPVIY